LWYATFLHMCVREREREWVNERFFDENAQLIRVNGNCNICCIKSSSSSGCDSEWSCVVEQQDQEWVRRWSSLSLNSINRRTTSSLSESFNKLSPIWRSFFIGLKWQNVRSTFSLGNKLSIFGSWESSLSESESPYREVVDDDDDDDAIVRELSDSFFSLDNRFESTTSLPYKHNVNVV
jgi:hypothetical protein